MRKSPGSHCVNINYTQKKPTKSWIRPNLELLVHIILHASALKYNNKWLRIRDEEKKKLDDDRNRRTNPIIAA